jgi:hypothetical protein
VDVSKYFTKILELDVSKRTVKVEPGVIRDELNEYLKPHGLFFENNNIRFYCHFGLMFVALTFLLSSYRSRILSSACVT